MAYSEDQWDKARAYYEAGTHSLADISNEVGIEKSSISKKAKIQQWKSATNSDYIEAKVIIAEKKSTLNSTALQILDDIAEEQIRHKRLINSNAERLGAKLSKMVDEIDSPADLKILSEANDRLAITLKVAERHAPKGDVTVNTQNINDNSTAPRAIEWVISE